MQRFPFLAGHAAAHTDHQIRSTSFQGSPPSQLREHLLLRLLPDRAGVQQQNIRLFRIIGRNEAVRQREDVPHLGGIVLVHLATKSLYVDALFHSDCWRWVHTEVRMLRHYFTKIRRLSFAPEPRTIARQPVVQAALATTVAREPRAGACCAGNTPFVSPCRCARPACAREGRLRTSPPLAAPGTVTPPACHRRHFIEPVHQTRAEPQQRLTLNLTDP